MKRRYDLYFNDILESTKRIKEYYKSETDEMMIDAILRNLEIIGEAVTQLPEDVKIKYNNIAWRDIQDFRIVVAHHYWKVNLNIVWDIVENKIPLLEKQIKEIMKKEKIN